MHPSKMRPWFESEEIFSVAWVGALEKIPASFVEERAWRATF
jgi:hypothetical protein